MQNPDIPRTGRVGESGAAAGRGRARLGANGIIGAFQFPNLSNPKPGHATGRSGRGGARQGGWAGWGWVGEDAVGSIRPRDNPPSCLSANRENSPGRYFGMTNSLIRIQNRQRSKIRSWPPVHLRFITWTKSALRSWPLRSLSSPIGLCNVNFCMQGMSGKK